MVIDRRDPTERLARIDSLIAEYRAIKQRRLLRTAIRLWRRSEARQRHVEPGTQPERVH